MPHVSLETVAPQLIAAVTSRVEIKDIMSAWKPALYPVKAYLADHPELAASGRHVFLYHHPTQRDQPMEIDFGIEVGASVRCRRWGALRDDARRTRRDGDPYRSADVAAANTHGDPPMVRRQRPRYRRLLLGDLHLGRRPRSGRDRGALCAALGVRRRVVEIEASPGTAQPIWLERDTPTGWRVPGGNVNHMPLTEQSPMLHLAKIVASRPC